MSTKEADPRSLEELLNAVAAEPDRTRASEAARAAMVCAGFKTRWKTWDELALFEALDDDQRRVAEAIGHRRDLGVGGFGMPSSPRLLRRWLGLDPPGALERRISWEHEGRTVEWPVWYAWKSAPDEALEAGQGIPEALLERLTPAEVIEAAGEASLENYGIETPYSHRVDAALGEHAAEAAGWARGFAETLASLRSPDSPHAREGVGYHSLGIYQWDALGVLALVPLVRAGIELDPQLDVIVPFAASTERVREVLSALPPERREAAVYRRLMTDWGPTGALALNGFVNGIVLLDLVPSERITRVLLGKLRNNRNHFKRSRDRHMARIESLAATEPGIAAGLKRLPKAKTPKPNKPAAVRAPGPRKTAVAKRSSPAKKSPVAKKKPSRAK